MANWEGRWCEREGCPFAHDVPNDVRALVRKTCLQCFKQKGKHARVCEAAGDVCDCPFDCYVCKIGPLCKHVVPEGQKQKGWRCNVCEVRSPCARDGSKRCQVCMDGEMTIPMR